MSSTPRHLKDRDPKYVLVVWPDDAVMLEPLPSCIELHGLADALDFGATVIGREDADFCKPRQPQPVEPSVMQILKDHTRRWRHDPRES